MNGETRPSQEVINTLEGKESHASFLKWITFHRENAQRVAKPAARHIARTALELLAALAPEFDTSGVRTSLSDRHFRHKLTEELSNGISVSSVGDRVRSCSATSSC